MREDASASNPLQAFGLGSQGVPLRSPIEKGGSCFPDRSRMSDREVRPALFIGPFMLCGLRFLEAVAHLPMELPVQAEELLVFIHPKPHGFVQQPPDKVGRRITIKSHRCDGDHLDLELMGIAA